MNQQKKRFYTDWLLANQWLDVIEPYYLVAGIGNFYTISYEDQKKIALIIVNYLLENGLLAMTYNDQTPFKTQDVQEWKAYISSMFAKSKSPEDLYRKGNICFVASSARIIKAGAKRTSILYENKYGQGDNMHAENEFEVIVKNEMTHLKSLFAEDYLEDSGQYLRAVDRQWIESISVEGAEPKNQRVIGAKNHEHLKLKKAIFNNYRRLFADHAYNWCVAFSYESRIPLTEPDRVLKNLISSPSYDTCLYDYWGRTGYHGFYRLSEMTSASFREVEIPEAYTAIKEWVTKYADHFVLDEEGNPYLKRADMDTISLDLLKSELGEGCRVYILNDHVLERDRDYFQVSMVIKYFLELVVVSSDGKKLVLLVYADD